MGPLAALPCPPKAVVPRTCEWHCLVPCNVSVFWGSGCGPSGSVGCGWQWQAESEGHRDLSVTMGVCLEATSPLSQSQCCRRAHATVASGVAHGEPGVWPVGLSPCGHPGSWVRMMLSGAGGLGLPVPSPRCTQAHGTQVFHPQWQGISPSRTRRHGGWGAHHWTVQEMVTEARRGQGSGESAGRAFWVEGTVGSKLRGACALPGREQCQRGRGLSCPVLSKGCGAWLGAES